MERFTPNCVVELIETKELWVGIFLMYLSNPKRIYLVLDGNPRERLTISGIVVSQRALWKKVCRGGLMKQLTGSQKT